MAWWSSKVKLNIRLLYCLFKSQKMSFKKLYTIRRIRRQCCSLAAASSWITKKIEASCVQKLYAMWLLCVCGWSIAGRWSGIVWRASTTATEEVSGKLLFSPSHASPMLCTVSIEVWRRLRLCPEHSLIVGVGPIKVMVGWWEGRINWLWICWAVCWNWENWAHTWGSACHWPLVNDTSSACHGWRNRRCHQMASTLWKLYLTWKKRVRGFCE